MSMGPKRVINDKKIGKQMVTNAEWNDIWYTCDDHKICVAGPQPLNTNAILLQIYTSCDSISKHMIVLKTVWMYTKDISTNHILLWVEDTTFMAAFAFVRAHSSYLTAGKLGQQTWWMDWKLIWTVRCILIMYNAWPKHGNYIHRNEKICNPHTACVFVFRTGNSCVLNSTWITVGTCWNPRNKTRCHHNPNYGWKCWQNNHYGATYLRIISCKRFSR